MNRIIVILFLAGIALLLSQCAPRISSVTNAGEESLYVIPDGVSSRWASAENPKGEKGKGGQTNGGRKGSPSISPLKNGSQVVLAEATGTSGMVRRIWITISDRSPQMVRGLRIDMYWDGASEPAVSAPIGDFFSQGLGTMVRFQSALFSDPEGRSFNCYIPMPFRKGMKIIVTNESGKDLGSLFYDVDYTVGDRLPKDVLYFHAYYHRENPTTLRQDYEILPRIEGRGRFLGCNIGVIANQQLLCALNDDDQAGCHHAGTGFRDRFPAGQSQTLDAGGAMFPTYRPSVDGFGQLGLHGRERLARQGISRALRWHGGLRMVLPEL